LNHSYQHDENAETKYLKSLISNFGNNNLQADEAIKKLNIRHEALKKRRSKFLSDTEQNTNGYYQLCLRIHFFLYKDILANAGKFRKINDPNNGNVYFGFNQRTQRDRFTGTNPQFIESELRDAFALLFNKQYQSIESSIRFYAEFIAIHPFYDANGRIGRYIIDTFLQSNNCYVDWQLLNQRHGKFLRKLNYCHSVRARYKQFLSSGNLNSNYYL
jgi:fido (protein-threonine AMPylation protein)